MPYRLLALDIDGTVLNSKVELTSPTSNAISALLQEGWMVTLVSGRRHLGMVDIARQLQVNAPIIAFNGGMIFDPYTYDILDLKTLKLPVIKDLLLCLFASGLTVRIYSGSFDGPQYVYYGENFITNLPPNPAEVIDPSLIPQRIYSFEELSFEPLRILIGGSEEETTRAKSLAAPWMTGCGIWAMHSYDYDGMWYLEFFPDGSDKAVGLSTLCTLLNISLSEVVAVGDNSNDIEMVREAGLGVAMGNAVPELKEVADMVIGHHDEDGLAAFIETLMKKVD